MKKGKTTKINGFRTSKVHYGTVDSKELKSKVIKTRQNSNLNNRKEFTKKSVEKRDMLNRAIYRQKLQLKVSV